MPDIKAYLFRDCHSGQWCITGDHDNIDTRSFGGLNGIIDLRSRRIDDTHHPQQYQIILYFVGIQPDPFGQHTFRQGQRTQTVRCQFAVGLFEGFSLFFLKRLYLRSVKIVVRTLQQHFRRPFDIGDAFLLLPDDDTHPFPLGVERELRCDPVLRIRAQPGFVGSYDQ